MPKRRPERYGFTQVQEGKRVVGDRLFCALAAQQQRAQAEEAKKEGTNCAPVTHNQ